MHVIDSAMFAAMIRSGAHDLQRHCDEVNNLNVFPVPDGDTGMNMLATLRGGVDAIAQIKSSSLGECCKALSRGMLLAARGNSGVILSQFFAGLTDTLANDKEANVIQFSRAFDSGVKRAYEVVVKPVEGTILTVMREGAQKSLEKVDSGTSFEEYFTYLLSSMKDSLEATPDLLPVLKEAGVIDSGGAGLLYIIEGMGQALGGKIIEDVSLGLHTRHDEMPLSVSDAFNENSILDYGYCTEFIFQLTNAKSGVNSFDLPKAIDYLGSIGDSLVAFQDGTLVKVHIHTKTPDKVISYALTYGEFVRFKMENMTLQHNQTLVEKSRDIAASVMPVKNDRNPLAVIAVVPNQEVGEVFKTYGADVLVDVGVFMNPGTEDFIKAFEEASAEDIIVLPNNKNEIMVAELAAGMYEESHIHVIHNDDIATGVTCCSVIDSVDLTAEDNVSRILATLEASTTAGIFRAVRDSSIKGEAITKGDYIYSQNDRFIRETTLSNAFIRWCEAYGGEERSLATLLHNDRVSEEELDAIKDYLESRYDFIEIQTYPSGNCLYDLYVVLD